MNDYDDFEPSALRVAGAVAFGLGLGVLMLGAVYLLAVLAAP